MKYTILSIIFLLACACSDSPEAAGVEEEHTQVPEAPITYEFTAEQSRAAKASLPFMEKFWLVAEEEMGSEENYIVSPLNADILLSMVANTSAGVLGEEIVAALGCTDKTVLNELASKYTVALPTIDDQITLGIYNSVWYRNSFRLNTNFGDKMEYYYNADVAGHPFDDTLIDAVNGWCNDKTRGLIPKIIYEVPDEAVMLLADALYLKGAWANPFEISNTTEEIFHGLKGDVNIKMMNSSGKQHYSECDNFKAVRMEIGNGAMDVLFILPSGNADLKHFLQDNIKAIQLAEFCDVEVEFSLPRFKYTSNQVYLNPLLATLGIKSINSDSCSEALIDCNKVEHKLFQRVSLEFNEKGAEGAAVSWDRFLTSNIESCTPVIRIDRPFFVVVRVAATGAPLFAGRINNL